MMNSTLMKSFAKPVMALALAGALSTAVVAPAEAGRNGHGNGKFFVGLGLGLLAGGLILNQNRYRTYNSNLYASDSYYDDDDRQSCYRSKRVVCSKKYSCEFDDYGNKFCQPHRSCYHPVICN